MAYLKLHRSTQSCTGILRNSTTTTTTSSPIKMPLFTSIEYNCLFKLFILFKELQCGIRVLYNSPIHKRWSDSLNTRTSRCPYSVESISKNKRLKGCLQCCRMGQNVIDNSTATRYVFHLAMACITLGHQFIGREVHGGCDNANY